MNNTLIIKQTNLAVGRIEKLKRKKPCAPLDDILNTISIRTRISLDELKSKTRERPVADARFVYFRRAREKTTLSSSAIGEKVNREHATVLHGIEEALSTKAVIELYEYCFGN